jgi:lipopolysaccharide biosynthesis regulator YciM
MQSQRMQALHELGQDYLKAGLLDRAEETLLELKGTSMRHEALVLLLEIYQQEKDWVKAIETARAIESESGENRQREVANFYCELAVADATHSRASEALANLDRALAANRKCVRASLHAGEIHAAAGGHAEAIETWKRVEQQQPEYVSLVARKLLDSFRAIDRTDEGLTLLRGYLNRYPSLDMLDVVFQCTLELKNAEEAYLLVKEELRRNPTLLGLDKLLEAQILIAPAERRQDLELVKNLVHGHTRRLARYRCANCGFKARQFHWRCPACSGWETYPPRRTEEFDLDP